jgi:hypothetical protein
LFLRSLCSPFQTRPIRQHHFETEHEIARVAVVKNGDAAGIGGEISADPARAFRAEAERKEQIMLLRRALHVGEDDAGFHGHRVVHGVDFAHGAHALEAHQHLRTAVVGRRAAAVARVATLRNDPDARRVAHLHDPRHFIGARRRTMSAARPW